MDTVIDVLGVLKNEGKKIVLCKKSCERLQKTLEGLISILNEPRHSGVDQSSDHGQEQFKEFFEELKKGRDMVRECSKVPFFKFWVLWTYGNKIDDLEEYITKFIQTKGWALTYSEVRQVRANLEVRFENFIKESIHLLEDGQKAFISSIPKLPDFRVGLEISVHELKKRLLCKDVSLLGVVGMGGSGKTTLAIAISNDIEVQGSTEEKDWCEMKFPNAKALILNFSATEYFLPAFIQSMHKLEVLMIFNHNAKRATLKGVSVFCSLTQLKVVHLEGVIIPPLQEYCQSWQQLQKLSLILCESFENMTPLHMLLDLNFPRLLEFTIDHCVQLKELPPTICQMTSLERLSVTNCHDLEKLSDDIEKLSSLKMLRLYACPNLKELPNSICKLKKLEFLDISLCHGIKQLPEELGQLSSLKKLDMRDCSRVKQLPKSVHDLRSQVRVICDKKIQVKWSDMIGSLKVEVAEEYHNLDWL